MRGGKGGVALSCSNACHLRVNFEALFTSTLARNTKLRHPTVTTGPVSMPYQRQPTQPACASSSIRINAAWCWPFRMAMPVPRRTALYVQRMAIDVVSAGSFRVDLLAHQSIHSPV